MKYLSDYLNDKITVLLDKHGAFYAFNKQQFAEKATAPVEEYTQLDGGLIVKKDQADELHKSMMEAVDAAIKEDIADNGIDNIIKRELCNHEYSYTGSIESTVDALIGYGIELDRIKTIAKYKD